MNDQICGSVMFWIAADHPDPECAKCGNTSLLYYSDGSLAAARPVTYVHGLPCQKIISHREGKDANKNMP